MKKPLYTGDPTATLTMCYTKHRRHTTNDFAYVMTKSEPIPVTNPKGMTVTIICKHCKLDPYIDPELETVSA